MGADDLDQTTKAAAVSPLLYLRAPFDGTVIDRRAAVGDVAEAGRPLVTICNLDSLWLDLAVSEATAARLAPGDPVTLRASGPGTVARGVVTWVAHSLDPVTRQVRVRAVVPNQDRRLRAGAYVEAEIALRAGEDAGIIDRDEVHRFGGHPFVFVRLEPDLFEVRRVELGPERDGAVAVSAGLSAEDLVVSEQSYLLKSEFQKSRLGAGCVD